MQIASKSHDLVPKASKSCLCLRGFAQFFLHPEKKKNKRWEEFFRVDGYFFIKHQKWKLYDSWRMRWNLRSGEEISPLELDSQQWNSSLAWRPLQSDNHGDTQPGKGKHIKIIRSPSSHRVTNEYFWVAFPIKVMRLKKGHFHFVTMAYLGRT